MPAVKDLKSTAACKCSASKLEVRGKLLTRFICHCTICQDLYKAPFSDVSVFWANSVKVIEPDSVSYKRYRLPPAVARGICCSCGTPVLGLMTLAPFIRIALLPSRSLAQAPALPEPSAHIFYHRRVADAADEAPKFSGYWPSEFAVSTRILAGMLR
jgi:hypothetical protein